VKQTYSLYSLLAAALLVSLTTRAQNVGIGTTTPNAAAALDITATGKGLLIPRLDSAARVGIANPPTGLMVFQTSPRVGFYYYAGGAWLYLPDKARSGDNLGNHTATQNLNLANKLLVGQAAATGTPGTTGLRVTETGAVGIGTTAPFSRLANTDANIISADGNGVNTGSLTWAANQGGYVGAFYNASTANNANVLALKTASTNNSAAVLDVSQSSSAASIGTSLLRVTGAGYLGLGTSNPGGRLHVVSSASGSDDDYLFDNYGANGDPSIYFRRAAGTPAAPANLTGGEQLGGVAFGARVAGNQGYADTYLRSYYTGNGTTASTDLRLGTSTIERLRIDANGRFSLGAGEPGGRFHLLTTATGADDDYLFDQYGTSGDQAIYFRRAAGTPAAPANLTGGEQLGGVGFGARAAGSQGYANSSVLAFYTGNGTTAESDLRFNTSTVERLRIVEDGNVGVGTPAPSSTLHVAGTLAVGVVASQPNTTATSPLDGLKAGYIGLLPAAAGRRFTLPDAATVPGREYHLRNTSGNNSLVLYAAGSSSFFDSGSSTGASTFTMEPSGTSKSITIISNGADWMIFRSGN
jgi:hypothetical protein